MSMIELNDAQRRLAARLRELRASWPDVAVTQRDLARAFGGDKPLSGPLVSPGETQANPNIPPPHRIESYAAFFATVRSMAVPERPRLLRDDELTDDERTARAELSAEPNRMRAGGGGCHREHVARTDVWPRPAVTRRPGSGHPAGQPGGAERRG